MATVIWKAPAKLNLFLHVVGRLENGYHQLQTVYQLIDWSDQLQFNVNPDGRISRTNEIEGIPQTECLTVKAARALRERCPGSDGVDIQLRKHVPVGSGLGGGSSDAGTTLVALNRLWNLWLSDDELAQVGAQVGADVPVFVYGRNAWGEGIGEKLSDINLTECPYLVVVPPVEVVTRRIFESIGPSSFRKEVTFQDFIDGNVSNDLEPATRRLYPEVDSALKWLGRHGPARMTGSGGAVFLPLEENRQAEEILKQLPTGYQGRICIGAGETPRG